MKWEMVWASLAASMLLFLPGRARGQQETSLQWQGSLPSPMVWQSTAPAAASPDVAPQTIQRSPSPQPPSPPATIKQSSRQSKQSPLPFQDQGLRHPNMQEIPAVWQPPAPVTNQSLPVLSAPPAPSSPAVPGYVGLHGRDFYRSRFCMHALTIQGVEVVTVEPKSPAARAGLRPAQPLTAQEVAIGAAAGLMTAAQAQPAATAFVSAFGGMPHGDIILAVAGRRVKMLNELQQELAQFGPQTVVYFTVRRGENVLQLPVRLTRGPAADAEDAKQVTYAPESH